jgi:hypothetical protein
MPRSAADNRNSAMHVLSYLDAIGESGATREEIMSHLGLPWRIDWFNAIMRHAREQAAVLGRVIPRPTGYVDPLRGDQAYCYRLTGVMGDMDGDVGARAGTVIALTDTLSRQRTQTATLKVLSTSGALTVAIRRELRRATTASEGQEVYLENLVSMVEMVP